MDRFFCIQCETCKPLSAFGKKGEHIIPRGFGNDGGPPFVLKKSICLDCNQRYGNAIDQPFLRHVTSREIEKNYGMKRRHSGTNIETNGSGFLIRYETTAAHILECVKIAFETHIFFLGEKYRDETFQLLRQFLHNIIVGYDELRIGLKGQCSHRRTLDHVWADTGQPAMISKNFDVVSKYIYRLDEIASNSTEVLSAVKERSADASYASLVQLGCCNIGVAVLICLQSLPPIVVHVCNQKKQYIEDFGYEHIFVADLRSNSKWIGSEDMS